MDQKPYWNSFLRLRYCIEDSMSWVVTFGMFTYGLSKPIQFKRTDLIDKTISKLSGFELMWAFYGYSDAYVFILGIFEVFGGLLLFFRRTRIIGCLISTSIFINIIIQDIIFGVPLGALRTALIYQVLIVIILILNAEKVISSFSVLIKRKQEHVPKQIIALNTVFTFFIFLVLKIFEYFFSRGF